MFKLALIVWFICVAPAAVLIGKVINLKPPEDE